MLVFILVVGSGLAFMWALANLGTAKKGQVDTFSGSPKSHNTDIVGMTHTSDSDRLCRHTSEGYDDDLMHINPATGLLMIGGIGGLDTNGNPYGIDGSVFGNNLHSDMNSSLMATHISDNDSFNSFDDRTSFDGFRDPW